MTSKDEDKRIIVVMPRITYPEGKREVVRQSPEEIWDEIVLGDLIMLGEFVVAEEVGDLGRVAPINYYCRNQMVVASGCRPYNAGHLDQFSFFLYEDKPASEWDKKETKLAFTTCFDVKSYRNLMLHLALKQMVPTLTHTADLIDLSYEHAARARTATKNTDVGELGFLAVAYDCLYGTVGTESRFARTYSLGFIVAPNLDTYAGCKGWDRWLQFLVFEKFIQLRGLLDTQALSLLGPKPLF